MAKPTNDEIIERVEGELVSLLDSCDIYGQFRNSMRTPRTNEDEAKVVEWINFMFLDSTCIAIRRLIDKDDDACSLWRLIIRIERNVAADASHLSLGEFRERYHAKGLPERLADEHYAALIASPSLAQRIQSDLAEMKSGTFEEFNRLTNKAIAHSLTKEVPSIRFSEIAKALNFLTEAFNRYKTLVAGANFDAGREDSDVGHIFARLWRDEG